MRRALSAAVLVVLVGLATGCGSHHFAGMPRERARQLAVADARAWRIITMDLAEFGYTQRAFRVLGTFPARNRSRHEAWLTIFRWPGGADQACVWIWRTGGGLSRYGYEEARSVANGRPWDPLHERCLASVRRRGYLVRDQTTASEVREPSPLDPPAVGPFGAAPRGSYLTDVDYGSLVETDIPLRFPASTARGTVAYAGLVLAGRREVPVRGARVTLRPSSLGSGISGPGPGTRGITALSGRGGAFSFVNLPAGPYGYDIVATVPGWAPYVEYHADLGPNVGPDPEAGVWVGSIHLTREPQFVDGTPYPVAPPGSGP